MLRLFEAGLGSGLGARIEIAGSESRADELLFSEFIGAALIEVPPDFSLNPHSTSYCMIGEVTAERELVVRHGDKEIVREPWTSLETSWSATFREVLG